MTVRPTRRSTGRTWRGTLIRLAVLPLALSLGHDDAQAHYPMLITEKAMVEANRPIRIVYTNGHPWWNDREPAPRAYRVEVWPPESSKINVTDKVKNIGTAELPKWELIYTPKADGDHIFAYACGIFHEPPMRRVVDFGKLFIHVKTESGAQVGWRRVVGHPIEIVPYTRPYAIPINTAFRGRVIRNVTDSKTKKVTTTPLVNAVVDGECYTPTKKPGKGYLANYRLGVQTDEHGYFVISLPRPGWWIIAVATDGGPGEQGTTRMMARRAVLWVEVGGTVWDTEWKQQDGEKK